MAFGKPGRPVKDPLRERLRIYRAAGPLVLERGVRGTTIRDVARAACLSPGGIYHYFGSKRELLLYGLQAQALSAACTVEASELHAAVAMEPRPDTAEIVRLYIDKTVRMLEFVRPALHAAVELGREELRHQLSTGLSEDARALVAALQIFQPHPAAARETADAIRRTILGLALDETVTPAMAGRALAAFFRRVTTEAPKHGLRAERLRPRGSRRPGPGKTP